MADETAPATWAHEESSVSLAKDSLIDRVGGAVASGVGVAAALIWLWAAAVLFCQIMCFLRSGEWVELPMYQILVEGPWPWDLYKPATPWNLVPDFLIRVMSPVETWTQWVGMGKVVKWLLSHFSFVLALLLTPIAVMGIIISVLSSLQESRSSRRSAT